MSIQERVTAPLAEIRHCVERCMLRMVTATVDRAVHVDEIRVALALLESVPLSSGEFAVASRRLYNARRYLVSDELGAATYELQLLLGGLKSRNVLATDTRLRRRS